MASRRNAPSSVAGMKSGLRDRRRGDDLADVIVAVNTPGTAPVNTTGEPDGTAHAWQASKPAPSAAASRSRPMNTMRLWR